MSDLIDRQAAIDALNEYFARIGKLKRRGLNKGEKAISLDTVGVIKTLPSAQPEWNNHTVACLLAEMFGDDCACNFNGIDEWLPYKCEVIDSCPNPARVACWEQFLKHRAERRSE